MWRSSGWMTSSFRLLQSGSSFTALSTMLPSMVMTPFSIFVSVPMTASVILICCLRSVRMTFFVPEGFAGAAGAAAAGATIGAAQPPSGMSMERPASFSAAPISMCIVPPAIVVATGAAGAGAGAAADVGAAGAGAGAAGVAGAPAFAFTWSSTPAVMGVSASTSCVSVAPRTSATVRPSGLSFKRPASSMSSKMPGSSRSAALMVRPFCRRQQKTAGSARWASACSFVMDMRDSSFVGSLSQ